MKSENIPKLRKVALSFLLPGLAGLIVSLVISLTYLQTMPTMPDPSTLRMTPRTIEGVTIYQTEEEDRRLNLIEYSSVGVFLLGVALGVVYLRVWGLEHALGAEDDLGYRAEE